MLDENWVSSFITGLNCVALAATLFSYKGSMDLVCAICLDRDYWLHTNCIVGMYWEFARFALLYWIEITCFIAPYFSLAALEQQLSHVQR
jgi:hypothetical protein